ncbi:sensor histidine kinase [Streptomyces sp. NPDC088551]|uniref:sensor histidine kinase n=1 Tax=Streptomyces sp. NPDC088551 TaxID=3365863 RepID=UPI0037F32D50
MRNHRRDTAPRPARRRLRGLGTALLAGARDISGPLTRQSLLVAVVCLVVDTLSFRFEGFHSYPGLWNWLVLAAIVLVDAALATSARRSGTVALAQAALLMTCAAFLPDGRPLPDLNDAGLLISAYRAGAWLTLRPAAVSLAGLATGIVASSLIAGAGLAQIHLLLIQAMQNALLPWLVGRYTTTRRAYIAELEQRSERERNHARQALTEAIAEERSAIARDLHDVIAHHVSAIGVHAGAARLGLTASPDTTALAGSLTAVEKSSRAAMLDLRRLLDFLHGNHSRGARQPGLDNIDELLHAVDSAGLTARLTTRGTPPVLPESLDMAVYRIVQELLTNALRHGDGSQVEVELAYTDTSLTLTAANPLPRPLRPHRPPESAQRGLAGIRGRAALFNGSATYGPTPDGTAWTTAVAFPLDRS